MMHEYKTFKSQDNIFNASLKAFKEEIQRSKAFGMESR